jgi:ubiquinone/menaquinone biosynthesis C-methylase UbiE
MAERTTETWQVDSSAAEVYEEKFVPAIFGEWAPHTIEAGRVQPGQHVLDVACGTGAVAREARKVVGTAGSVTGLDLNEGMLAVTRRLGPDIDWRKGDVAAIPFDDHTFQAVLCQAALMYFLDRVAALQEMRRVAAEGARIAVQVWGSMQESPGYVTLKELTVRYVGEKAGDILSAPFVLSDTAELYVLFEAAGYTDVHIRTRIGRLRMSSIDEFVRAEIEGSPIAPLIREKGAEVYEAYLEACRRELAVFCPDGNEIVFNLPGHIVSAI